MGTFRPHRAALLFLPACLACSSSSELAPRAAAASPDGGGAVALPALVNEAGFLDLPPQPTAATYAARMFYVFQAADADAAHKPLLVFFNGGPGFPTSAGLLTWGTGRFTLDPNAPAGSPPISNPASWTRFANLLYLDERLSGFSYGLGARPPTLAFSPIEDAGDFVRALLEFMDAHVALRASPVTLVGESYGGERASWMLDLLLRYETDADQAGSDLRALIQAHYDAVFPDHAGEVFDESAAAMQFGTEVLIQPLVLGSLQSDASEALWPSDPFIGSGLLQDGDIYNRKKPSGWSEWLDGRALAALSDAKAAAALLGVDLDAIPGLQPAARKAAFIDPLSVPCPGAADVPDAGPVPLTPPPPPPEVEAGVPPVSPDDAGTPLPVVDPAAAATAANTELRALLGPLRRGDDYIAFERVQCLHAKGDLHGLLPVNAFLANLHHVRTFITHARYDWVIYAPAIPGALAKQGWGAAIDSSPRPGVARPGWFTVNLPATTTAPSETATTIEVRFPLYDQSGHMVAVTQPAELASDVESWLNEK